MPLPPPPARLLDDASLFLDFDGTLVEIAERHDAIAVPAGLAALLIRAADALGGRLAIVSGRGVDEIVRYLGLDAAAPGIAVAGSHGLEQLSMDGRRETPTASPGVSIAIEAFDAAAGRMSGVVAEAKPFGAAIHYRGAPECEAACEALAMDVARNTGLVVQRGKMVCELRMPGIDKGGALDLLITMPPMQDHRPIFVGDDLTDEAGFRAATAAGGAGILVGERAGSAARYALPDVAAVLDWLGAAVG